MKNKDKFVSILAILGSLASIVSLGYFGFNNIFSSFIVKDFLIGVLGSIVGTIVSLIALRIFSKAKAPSVFISYHHSNKEIAKKIATELKKISGHVWMDEFEISIGDSITEKIDSGLKSSDYFLILLSEEANKSRWSERELSNALKLGKTILPVKIDTSEVPKSIADIAYADISKSFESGMKKIQNVFNLRVDNSKISASNNT